MAYTGVLCTLSGIKVFAGENVDSTGMDDETLVNLLVGYAEQYCGLIGNYDFVANVASLTALGKQVLAEYCARSAALSLIAYNTGGYTTRIEAEDMMNVNIWRMRSIEKWLEDPNFVKRITGL